MKDSDNNQDHVYVLKTVSEYMRAYGGFKWPEKGHVECPDWDPKPRCGGGLHGFLKGEGFGSLADWSPKAKWLVIKVASDSVVKVDEDKCKFPRGEVVFCGDQQSATALIQEKHPEARAIIGATATAGDRGIATAGYKGTATAGYDGTATAGNEGTATAGDYGTATAGDGGTATAGKYGTATAGVSGTATAGVSGTATAGDRGTATARNEGTAMAEDYGTATAGDYGTATAGEYGTATAEYKGTATAGTGGTIQIKYWDKTTERYKIKTGYIGEDWLEPNVAYRLDDNDEFVKA